jgi:hypothetical protein
VTPPSEVLDLGANMGIGVGLVLVAIGAVLAFAVHAVVSGVDIRTVGVILMAVGAVGVVIELAIFAPRRRSVTTYAAAPATAAPTAAAPATASAGQTVVPGSVTHVES